MTLQKLYDQTKQAFIAIGDEMKKTTIQDTSALPNWNTLAFKIVRLQANIRNKHADRTHELLTSIKEVSPKARNEMGNVMSESDDHKYIELFTTFETNIEEMINWTKTNIEQEQEGSHRAAITQQP